MDQSMLIQVVLIFGFMIYTQIGTKKVNKVRFALPLIITFIVGRKYIDSIPTDGSNLTVLICTAVVGILFGILLVLNTKVFKKNGLYYTQAGLSYAIVLLVSFGSRLGLQYYIENNQVSFGKFLFENHINPAVIAPSFILLVVTMILVRILGVLVKIKQLNT